MSQKEEQIGLKVEVAKVTETSLDPHDGSEE